MLDTFVGEVASTFIKFGIKLIRNAKYMTSFYDAAKSQTYYIEEENRSNFEELLVILFNKENAENIKEIAKTNSGYTVIGEIQSFLYRECTTICEDEAIRPTLIRHINAYCKYVQNVMRKYKPDEFDRVFLSDFKQLTEEQLTQALSQLQELPNAIEKSEKKIIASVDSLKDEVVKDIHASTEKIIEAVKNLKILGSTDNKITIRELSSKIQAEMITKFIGACCFEENLYHRFGDAGYRKVSIESVYQAQKCVLYSWSGNNRIYKDAIAKGRDYFKDKFSNYDESNHTIMREVDQFYTRNTRDLLGFLKIFVNAECYHDYDKDSIELFFDSTDVVPTTCYIYGDVGIGKTTLTSRMCVDSTAFGSKRVFFVRFRELCTQHNETAYIDRNNNKIIIDFSDINDGDVLWLDGLDEAMNCSGNITALNTIKSTLKGKMVRYIITSRPRQERLNDDNIVVRIAPFDQSMIRKYAEQYYSKNECIKSLGLKNIISITEKEDNEFYHHYRILTVPFILYMFLYNGLLKEAAGQKSKSNDNMDLDIKMKLYHELLGEDSYIFKNVVYDGKIKRANVTEIKKYRDMAKEIAFEMFRQNRLFIQYEISEEQKKNRVFEFYLHGEKNNNSKYSVEFIHQSFHEYFLAEKLIEELLESLNKDDFRKTLNKVFGVNRIEPSLISFMDYLISEKFYSTIVSNKCSVLLRLFANLNIFVREFCISKNYFDNITYYSNKSLDQVAVNTLANYISILLCLSEIQQDTMEEFKDNELILRSDMSNLLKNNEGYINLGGLRYFGSFTRVKLSGVDLSGADLREADLREADLREAYLRGVDLRGADLHELDLHGAVLLEADLRGADLRGANLRGADLRGADLSGANLREAILFEAILFESKLLGDRFTRNIILKNADFLDASFEFKKDRLIKKNGGILGHTY